MALITHDRVIGMVVVGCRTEEGLVKGSGLLGCLHGLQIMYLERFLLLLLFFLTLCSIFNWLLAIGMFFLCSFDSVIRFVVEVSPKCGWIVLCETRQLG